MAMMTETPTTRKAPKAFYAHLYDMSGALCKVNRILYFVGDEGAIVEVEPSMVSWLTVLGEIGLSECQALMDRLHGGYAAVACSRAQEVR